jgi:hypothetical protein
MEADHGNNADDSFESQQQQAPSSQAGRPNLRGKPDTIAKATEGLTER